MKSTCISPRLGLLALAAGTVLATLPIMQCTAEASSVGGKGNGSASRRENLPHSEINHPIVSGAIHPSGPSRVSSPFLARLRAGGDVHAHSWQEALSYAEELGDNQTLEVTGTRTDGVGVRVQVRVSTYAYRSYEWAQSGLKVTLHGSHDLHSEIRRLPKDTPMSSLTVHILRSGESNYTY